VLALGSPPTGTEFARPDAEGIEMKKSWVLCRQLGSCGFLSGNHIYIVRMKLDIRIITLYRYFGYAAAQMRTLFRQQMDKEGKEWLEMMRDDKLGLVFFLFSWPGLYLMYSYAGTYLVIEGWKNLGLHDPTIDKLIESPFVDRLRLFRNATFHYQKDPMSWKHLQFFGAEEERTEVWLNSLYREFERFFGENTLPIPDKLKASFKDKTHVQIAQAIQEYWKENPFAQSPAGDVLKAAPEE